jgi:general secretion pathway protein F
VFTRQLAVLIKAGLPLTLALNTIATANDNRQLATILNTLKTQILSGYSLAAALGQQTKLFSKQYCAVIAAGEKSASLAQSLTYLADYLEQLANRQHKLINALVYPVAILLIAFVIVVVLMVQVMPQILALYAHASVSLPLATRMLLLMYTNKSWAIYFAGLLILAAVMFARFWQKHQIFRVKVQLCLINMPLLGKILVDINVARYLRTLAMLSIAGIPLVDAMQSAAATVTLMPMQLVLEQARRQVVTGMALYCAYSHTKYFAPWLLQLMASGEVGGNLPAMLLYSAEQGELELDNYLARLLSLIEPLLILVLGVVIALIILAILMPIVALNDLIN